MPGEQINYSEQTFCRIVTHLAILTYKTTIKLGNLENVGACVSGRGGGGGGLGGGGGGGGGFGV